MKVTSGQNTSYQIMSDSVICHSRYFSFYGMTMAEVLLKNEVEGTKKADTRNVEYIPGSTRSIHHYILIGGWFILNI